MPTSCTPAVERIARVLAGRHLSLNGEGQDAHASSAVDALADCERLEEIDLSSCALTVVPASVGRLKRLKTLNIENNVGVHTIPSDVFKSCEALTKLVAYRTSVRNVEYTDGYDTYVERVKMRHGKIISGNSMIGDERRGLDYGFDHTPS